MAVEGTVVTEPNPAGAKPAGTEPVAKAGDQTPNGTTTVVAKPDTAPDKSGSDRERGLLTDLQKERVARQRLEQQLQQHQNDLKAERLRVQALAGVTPKSDEDVELEAVKARVVQMFPALAKLDEKALERLLAVANNADSLEEATQHHWVSHGRQMVDALNEQVADELGVDKLNDRQRKQLGRAYLSMLEDDPESLKRHNAGDKALIQEFAKAYTEDWFESARKTVVTNEVSRRRPVPNGRDRSVQTSPAKKIDFKDEKAVSDAMVESYRSHGGKFDN